MTKESKSYTTPLNHIKSNIFGSTPTLVLRYRSYLGSIQLNCLKHSEPFKAAMNSFDILGRIAAWTNFGSLSRGRIKVFGRASPRSELQCLTELNVQVGPRWYLILTKTWSQTDHLFNRTHNISCRDTSRELLIVLPRNAIQWKPFRSSLDTIAYSGSFGRGAKKFAKISATFLPELLSS